MPPSEFEPIAFFACRQEHVALGAALAEVAIETLRSGRMLQGPEVTAFEASIAERTARRHAIAVGSGTDALFFALVAGGVRPGDEVLVTDMSFVASASAILRAGAVPVFCDIGRDGNLDLNRAAARITRRTRSLLFVHLFGGMSNPAVIEAFAAAHNLLLIEDAAQGFGASYGGRRCGGTGLVSALSFDPTKVLAAPGSGGAVLTDDQDLARRVRRLRYHGKEGAASSVELGYNSQMPSLTAAVLNLKLSYHDRWTDRRRVIAACYRTAFADLGLGFPEHDPEVDHVWHKFPVRSPDRDHLVAALAIAGVPTMIHYPKPFHREPMFAAGVTHPADFPEADSFTAETLSLPIHAFLSDAAVAHVIAAVRHVVG